MVGLEGTGGDAPHEYRKELEEQLKKDGMDNPREMLASRDNALVVVAAQIPPGARKGDALDLEVTLPPQSKTSSLRGGVLKECVLFNYARSAVPKGGTHCADAHLLRRPALWRLVAAKGMDRRACNRAMCGVAAGATSTAAST